MAGAISLPCGASTSEELRWPWKLVSLLFQLRGPKGRIEEVLDVTNTRNLLGTLNLQIGCSTGMLNIVLTREARPSRLLRLQ